MVTSAEAGAAAIKEASNADRSFRAAIFASGIFPRNGPDPSARSWSHQSSGVTFAAQHKLPKLPLPSLESLCKRYLDALKSLQLAQEQEVSAEAVKTFIEGERPILQAQLKEYDDNHENYFEHFCEPYPLKKASRKFHPGPNVQWQATKASWVMIPVSR